MQTQVWASAASLIGVALGGGLSYLAQLAAQRRADRVEASQLAETRRHERLELLRQFIQVAQDAERAAEERAASAEWLAGARDVMDRLWVCERMIHVLFGPSLHQPARAYVHAVNHVLWQEPADGSMWDHLQGPKTEFLGAANAEIA